MMAMEKDIMNKKNKTKVAKKKEAASDLIKATTKGSLDKLNDLVGKLDDSKDKLSTEPTVEDASLDKLKEP